MKKMHFPTVDHRNLHEIIGFFANACLNGLVFGHSDNYIYGTPAAQKEL
jgi:hypothetical protein